MIQWKGFGSQRLLWVFVTLLVIGCVAAAAVAGTLYYRSADQIDLTIDLIPENGYFMERTIPLGAAAPAQSLSDPRWTALPPTMAADYEIRDEYDVVWDTDTKVEIFKTSYENAEGQITVAGENGAKVIAPGTENDYTFALLNNGRGTLDYKVTMEAFFSGLTDDKVIPVEVRVTGVNGFLLGDETNWAPVLELNTVEETAVVEQRKSSVYTLEWRWPFESDPDGDGNVSDGDALDTWLASQGEDVTLTIRIVTTSVYHPMDDDDGDDGPTGGGGSGGAPGTGGDPSDPDNPAQPGQPPEPPVVPPITEPVPRLLLQDDHFSRHMTYIYGYEDGTLRPEANVTRAEVAAIFYRLVNVKYRTEYETEQCDYSDVATDAWHRREVATMTKMGILRGYPDGTFRPDEYITRAELTVIAARFLEQMWMPDSKTNFTDIHGHWADEEIRIVEDKNWILGYPDGTFRPDAPITRGETVTIVNRMLHRLPEQFEDLLEEMPTWSDNEDLYMWYYIAMQEAAVGHSCEYLWGTREQWTGYIEELPENP